MSVTRNDFVKGADCTTPDPRANRQGSAVVVDQYLQWALEGRVFVASAGSETTPLTALAYDQDQPEFVLSVPTGTSVVALSIIVDTEGSGGTAKEVIVWRVTNEVGNGTSTAATEGPTNLRSDSPRAALAVPRQLYTANITQTAYREIWRQSTTIASIAPFTYEYAPRSPLIIVGPGSIGVQFAATTTQPTFFLKMTWAEFATDDLK